MADPNELAVSSAQADALGGTKDDRTGRTYIVEGVNFFDSDTNNNAIINRVQDVPNQLRLVKTDSGLGYGVFSGVFSHGLNQVAYAGATSTLTNDATNYAYLTPTGTLTKNTTGFPVTPHFPIATVLTGTASAAAVTSEYNFEDITDNRGSGMWSTSIRPTVQVLTSQTLNFGDFDDNLDATGGILFDSFLPAGALVLGWKAVVSTGFQGNTTAVIKVGETGNDNRYSADETQSVFAAATVGSGALQAEAFVGAATSTPLVTVTEDSDWGDISQGSMVVSVFYVEMT